MQYILLSLDLRDEANARSIFLEEQSTKPQTSTRRSILIAQDLTENISEDDRKICAHKRIIEQKLG